MLVFLEKPICFFPPGNQAEGEEKKDWATGLVSRERTERKDSKIPQEQLF